MPTPTQKDSEVRAHVSDRQVNIGSFDDTPDEDGNVPTPPVGFLPTPDLFDLSQEYEGEFDPMNIRVYLETPINFMAKVFLRNSTYHICQSRT